MPYQDPFHWQYTQPQPPSQYEPSTIQSGMTPPHAGPNIANAFFRNANAARINTDIHMYNILKQAHPDVDIIDTNYYTANIIAYIEATGDGEIKPLTDANPAGSHPKLTPGPTSLHHAIYSPPYRRLDGGTGSISIDTIFDRFLVTWKSHEFLIYIADVSDGMYPVYGKRQYILTSFKSVVFTLLRTVGLWTNTLHGEIWVFNQGWWQKDPGLWKSIQKSRWEDIILPEDLKEDLLETVLRFYDSREQYSRLHVPWKRGLIFYGPPGNGKTVSIKATMKTLYDRKEPVPTLYVKTFTSMLGAEYSINSVFEKARQEAPCYLVFEDLDSLVTDEVRSAFLNAVDGLSENEGILMVGSTNHVDKLDPGLAKRPSRFDRKYLFDDPNETQREKYCQYWQKKLENNKEVEFPDVLVTPIAKLMHGFSFAYMQEAFVSTLLKIAGGNAKDMDVPKQQDENLKRLRAIINSEKRGRRANKDDIWDMVELDEELQHAEGVNNHGNTVEPEEDLNQYKLWREIKEQIQNLRKGLDMGTDRLTST